MSSAGFLFDGKIVHITPAFGLGRREERLFYMENGIIQVGIAGFGMSGQVFHAPFLDADPRFRIRKVFERTSSRAQKLYPYVETVRQFEGLLTEEVDLVVVSTPNPLHYPMARQALEAGKHVVVEKPAAATAQEVRDLIGLARQKGLLFTVYQNRRLDGDFRTIQALLAKNTLGQIVDYEAHFDRFVRGPYSKRWKAQGGRGISILYDLGVHLLDQVYVLFGMPQAVFADFRQQRDVSPGFDNFRLTLYYRDMQAAVSAGEVVALPGPHFQLHGRKGSFQKYGMDVQEAALIAGGKPGGAHWGEDSPEGYGTLAVDTGDGLEIFRVPTIPGNYGDYYDSIYRCLTRGEEPLVNPEDAVQVLRIIEAATRSAQSHAQEPII